MGQLRQLNGGITYPLQAEHLVGRGPQCALRIDERYVSAQHALIRWNGQRWQLIDRGSRNGTRLGSQRLDAGRPYDLEPGANIAFGRSSEAWFLEDATAPRVMLTRMGSAQSLLAEEGAITVSSADGASARCVIYRVKDNLWQVDHPERQPRLIQDGDIIEIDGELYRFSCPLAIGSTVADEAGAERVAAEFRVSSDEEFIELSLRYASRRIPLGCRGHNYLLLVLARARLADAAAGIDDGNCGWVYKNDLAESLRIAAQHVDGEVFRIRAHFAQHSVESARIIERRPRTTQLRFGISEIEILPM